jgi:hypothetical protein
MVYLLRIFDKHNRQIAFEESQCYAMQPIAACIIAFDLPRGIAADVARSGQRANRNGHSTARANTLGR